MKWYERIITQIKKIFGKQQLKLPEGAQNKMQNNTQQEFQDRIKEENPNYELNTVEGAIEQWLSALLFRQNNNMNIDSYSALIDLGASDDTAKPGHNPENEKQLLQILRENKDILINEQKNSKNNVTVFYHIQKGESEKCTSRIYLNCRRKDVAFVVNEIVKRLNDVENYYFKFDSDEYMRNEK